MRYLSIAILLLATSASADHVKRVRVSPSHGEISHASKHPCGDEVEHEVWRHVLEQPVVTIGDDWLAIAIDGQSVRAARYADVGDPITGYWRLDDTTQLGISVRREVRSLSNKGAWYKLVVVGVSVIKRDGTPDYCYEQWIGGAVVQP